MSATPSPRPRLARRALGALGSVLLVVGAFPLLAPTCGTGTPGVKTFARGSLVIPMDRCYQDTPDGVTASRPATGCPQAPAAGDVIKAYGLVYQLVRNGVAVSWVVDPAKAAVDGVDLDVTYGNGFPVLRYDWATGGTAGAPVADHVIHYRGGPFVVDGSDAAKASAILQQLAATFAPVNVHVANVAFQAPVAKTMAGGWSAGGPVAPKLALLDIGSGNVTSRSPLAIADPKNAEPVIEGYLARAGIGLGSAAGTAGGPHGEIYDKLGLADFEPDASGDWRTSALGRNGYEILWVPHWVAPGSCATPSTSATCQSTIYPTERVGRVLGAIGAFVGSGRDLFAECAGLGSFEGAFEAGSSTAYAIDYEDGDPSTRFQTTTGVRYDGIPDQISSADGKQLSPARFLGSFGSPLVQVGDWPFLPYTGAIEDYRPGDASADGAYHADVTRLVAASGAYADWDYFTVRPSRGDVTPHGTIVYLAGHSYSGVQGPFQVAGARLVLNTLFDLGAGCTESGVACVTGALGVCGDGVLACGADGTTVCAQRRFPSAERCNGLDDDCDGLVDEDLRETCYDGPAGTAGVGSCVEGVRTCERRGDGTFAMSACTGEVVPVGETCDGLDDDCDGAVDEALAQACYHGPAETVDPVTGLPYGACRAGTQRCASGGWTACDGEVLPSPEQCGDESAPADENCNGVTDEVCACATGQARACYEGPAGTRGVGSCRAGTQRCDAGAWSACAGAVLPAVESCNGVDDDCDGVVDDGGVCGECADGATRPCWPGPAGVEGVGTCAAGIETCAGRRWGACAGPILPGAEACNGVDDDCDGAVDDGAACGAGLACVNGVCVTSTCGDERPCPDGYACDAAHACVVAACGAAACAPGLVCAGGACVDPCDRVTCGPGSVCAGGLCTGGSCYPTGCPAGELCRGGACRPDACADVRCPAGTFCRGGDCVQACAFVQCASGERCGEDGFCVADPCAGRTCPAGERCADGTCEADPCAAVSCGAGQACVDGRCGDDPCAGVACPAGQCLRGQCFSTSNPTGAGSDPEPAPRGGGCGSGGAGPLAAAGLLAAWAARRRRAAAALLLAAGLAASACSGDGPARFDPATCAQICEAGSCTPLTCGEDRCVDLASDPSHCGRCEQSCVAGHVCVDGACGPSGWVGPRIATVTPASGPTGALAPVAVTLTGERFAPGAVVRVSSTAGTTTVPAEVIDAGRLRAALDLSSAPAGVLQLRVVNPDRVISNAVAFGVELRSPALTAVSPRAAVTGGEAPLRLSGSGFTPSSQCHVASERFPAQGVPTAHDGADLLCAIAALPPAEFQVWVVNDGVLASNRLSFTVTSADPILLAVSPSAAQAGRIVAVELSGSGFDPTSTAVFDGADVGTAVLDATRLSVPQLDLGGRGEGTYAIRVRNGAKLSAPLPFVVEAQPPTATRLRVTPTTPRQGETATLAIDGIDLPAGTALEARPPAGAFAALPTAGASPTSVSAALDLRGRPEGLWEARLAFPAGTASQAFAFRVLSNVAVLRSATPSGAKQGETLAVVLKASNLQAGAKAQLVDGAARRDLATAVALPDTLTVTGLSLAGLATGPYGLVAVNPGAAPSNAVSFTVMPGPPTLASVTPTQAVQQDAPVVVTLRGTNFARPDASGNGASVVMFHAGFMAAGEWAPAPGPITVASPSELRVALDTRAAYAAPGGTRYQVAVWNPGGDPSPQQSNGDLTFTVLP